MTVGRCATPPIRDSDVWSDRVATAVTPGQVWPTRGTSYVTQRRTCVRSNKYTIRVLLKLRFSIVLTTSRPSHETRKYYILLLFWGKSQFLFFHFFLFDTTAGHNARSGTRRTLGVAIVMTAHNGHTATAITIITWVMDIGLDVLLIATVTDKSWPRRKIYMYIYIKQTLHKRYIYITIIVSDRIVNDSMDCVLLFSPGPRVMW